jgi:uncharacterized protein YndB with AHSA1/START domain
VPTSSRSRTIAAPIEELWDVISDPHHLPRWWPRVNRVEDVENDRFTEVMTTAKGKVVRADFRILAADQSARSLTWEQLVEGTPFGHVLKAAQTEVRLTAVESATAVTIELRQTLNGVFTRFGGYMVRRAANGTVQGALEGLERISA